MSKKKKTFEIRAKKSIFQTVAHLSSKFHSAANVFCGKTTNPLVRQEQEASV